MLRKHFVVLLGLVLGLGVLAACSGQAATEIAPTQRVAAPSAEATHEQPVQEAAEPAGTVAETTSEQNDPAKEVAAEQANQPVAAPTAQIDTPGQALVCAGELEPTASNAEGPYYKSGAPERTSLVEPDMAGTRLLLTGQVLTTGCQPVAGALLDFWQADDQGEYDNVGYTLRGRQFSDEMGRYRLETIVPGRYPGRPPHIHVKVNAPGGPVLTTQIYFEGEPGNESDTLISPSLIVALRDTSDGGKAATFNFILVAEQAASTLEEYPLPSGSRPHDVAPALDGGVWYTAQGSGELGWLDPTSGAVRRIPLGQESAPHGVITGPDGAAWVTDGGLNAILRVDPATGEVQRFPLPEGSGYANLNTATFDQSGLLWFTGQSGIYGRLDPASGQIEVFEAPRGRGPYGISTTPDGAVYYASLAGSYIARLDLKTGAANVLEPPTPNQGARRVWSDSGGHVWVSEWNAGQVARYDPATNEWREWRLPGDNPLPYAVYVDEQDIVWLSDFSGNALVRFDPQQETFEVHTLPSSGANVRQILGRSGEVWGAESGTDKLVVIRTR
jgi:virginiamycin B lyase